MEERNEHTKMLDMMLRPAFSVKDGVICHVNQAAGQFLLCAGTPVAPLILAGTEEYAEFSDGCLNLTLSIGDQPISTSVMRMGDADIFMPEQPAKESELQALALAAMEMRKPLTGLMSMMRQLPFNGDPARQAEAAQANRQLFQMLRLVSNMSDALDYSQADSCRMEYTEMCGFLEEILVKAADLLAHTGLTLRPSLPNAPVYTLADRGKLERAVYNLLSNAAKYAPHGSTIDVQLTCRNRRVYLSVADHGPGLDHQNIFTRYLREPGLEDSRLGLGLGMVLIRSTAALHGGAVLVDHPSGYGNRATMTLAVRQSKSVQVRSPRFYPDYAGEWDHGLLELADVLPAALYSSDNI